MKKTMESIIEKYKNLSKPVKASLFFVLCSFIQKGISIITSPIFTRLLSTAEYGEYTLYNSWLDIFSIFVTLKLSEAIFNKTMVATEDCEKRMCLSSYQVLLTILYICFTVVYVFLHKEINSIIGLTNILMITMFVNIFLDGTIKLWMAFERFEYKYISLIIVSILISILNPVIGIIAVINMKDKVFGRVLGIIITEVIIGIVIYIYNIKKFKLSNFKTIAKKALLFNIPLLPHYLSQILLNHADRIMIGKIKSSSQVALYGVAYTIGMLITLITQSINNAYVPSMYRNIKKKNITKIINTNYILLCFITLIIIIVFMIIPEVILLFGGNKYYESIYAVYPIATSVLFIFMYTLFANIELYYNKRRYVTIGTCLSALLNIILNYIFINKYGYIAAAYTTLLCYLCYGFFHIFVSKKIIEKNENIKTNFYIKKIIILSSILIFISMILQLLVKYIVIRYLILMFIIIFLICRRKDIVEKLKKDIKGDVTL